MDFVESLIGGDFLSFLREIMQHVITEIIAAASAAPNWGEAYATPQVQPCITSGNDWPCHDPIVSTDGPP